MRSARQRTTLPRLLLSLAFAWVLWVRSVTLTAPPNDPNRVRVPDPWHLDSAYVFKTSCVIAGFYHQQVNKPRRPYTYPLNATPETWCLPDGVRPWEAER
jgi:hypothetical protein